MIARKFSLLRQLAVGGDPRDRIRHTLVRARALARHFDSTGLAGRESVGLRKTRGQVRRHAPDPEHPARQSVSGDLSRLERRRAGRSGQKRPAPAVYLVRRAGDTGLLFPAGQAGSRGSRSLWMSESPPSTGSSCTTASRTERATSSAYERTSNRRVGFIGLSGFRADPVPAAEWIPVRRRMDFDWSSAPVSIYSGHAWVLRPAAGDVPPRLVYVPSGNHLRQVDLAARTVTTVFETPEPIESVGIPTLAYWSTGHSTTEQPILVRTTQQIHELDQQHQRQQGVQPPGRSRPAELGRVV